MRLLKARPQAILLTCHQALNEAHSMYASMRHSYFRDTAFRFNIGYHVHTNTIKDKLVKLENRVSAKDLACIEDLRITQDHICTNLGPFKRSFTLKDRRGVWLEQRHYEQRSHEHWLDSEIYLSVVSISSRSAIKTAEHASREAALLDTGVYQGYWDRNGRVEYVVPLMEQIWEIVLPGSGRPARRYEAREALGGGTWGKVLECLCLS